jgi:hypothetical protein
MTTAAQVWAFALADGNAASLDLASARQYGLDVHRVHGLSEPLVIDSAQRVAGPIEQNVNTLPGGVELERTT